MSIRIKIYHNDCPEDIEKKLKEKFGDDLKMEKTSSGEIVASVDDRGTGWQRLWVVDDFLDELRDGNEFIHQVDVIG
jgi:hypothetical protein